MWKLSRPRGEQRRQQLTKKVEEEDKGNLSIPASHDRLLYRFLPATWSRYRSFVRLLALAAAAAAADVIAAKTRLGPSPVCVCVQLLESGWFLRLLAGN